MIKGTQISGAGCEGGRRSGKHWSWILIKSLNVWRLDSLSPPDSNNLPHFLGASLSSSAPPPLAYLRRSPPLPFPPRRLPVIYAKRSLHLRALLMCFFFPVCWIISPRADPVALFCGGAGVPRTSHSEPFGTARTSGSSQWPLLPAVWRFQSFAIDHRQEVGSQETVSSAPNTKSWGYDRIVGPDSFCVHVRRWRVISNSSHPENVLSRMWCF